jgi:hypothetical protein
MPSFDLKIDLSANVTQAYFDIKNCFLSLFCSSHFERVQHEFSLKNPKCAQDKQLATGWTKLL